MYHIIVNKKPYDNIKFDIDSIDDALLLAHELHKTIGSAKGDRYIDRSDPFAPTRKTCDWLVIDSNDSICDVPRHGSHEYYEAIWATRRVKSKMAHKELYAQTKIRKTHGRKPQARMDQTNRHTVSAAHNMRECADYELIEFICPKSARMPSKPHKMPWRKISKSWKDQSKQPCQWRPITV